MEITITGAASALVAPELGRLHLTVSFSGGDKSETLQQTQSRTNSLVAELEQLPADVLDDFVVGGVTTYSHRPWDGQTRRPTTHVASCRITAVFTDFSTLSQASADWAEQDGVEVGHISWQLTEATRDETLTSLVGEALDSARAKALLIAGHLGMTDVDVVKVSDHSPGDARMESAAFASPMLARGAVAEPVEPRPEDIRLETSLTVLFSAG